MSPPGTFERVYAAIKERLRKGAFRPGERLEPSALSDQLNSSVTPIRDALHRLTGERLVEAPRHEGFRVPLVTESMLRHLYAWHLDLLLLATARRHWGPVSVEGTGGDTSLAQTSQLDRQNALFLRLAEAGGNPEHLVALRALVDRMEPYQLFESELLDAIQTETENIAAAIAAGDRRSLRKRLVAYHRRRARLVPELIARSRSDQGLPAR
ncbi:MAG TPA: GntR family transcriptional regulator [Sphingomicrobium sp.]|nr:GntR family transcriptional regulator [Sphingomicrobium sp.]